MRHTILSERMRHTLTSLATSEQLERPEQGLSGHLLTADTRSARSSRRSASPREVEEAGSEGQTRAHEVGSFCSNGSRNIVRETFPRGSFATTDWENATQ
jgi:hypothetical protein